MSRKGGSRSSSKKAKKAGSNVFDMFSQKQVAEYKEGFQLMDRDRDGVLGKEDLRAMYDEIGRISTEEELESMLADAPGPINFTMFLNMFGERSSGEADDDEVVAKAFMAFAGEDGMADCEEFREKLMQFGDKFTNQEVDDALETFDIDENNKFEMQKVIAMLTASAKPEEEEPAPEA